MKACKRNKTENDQVFFSPRIAVFPFEAPSESRLKACRRTGSGENKLRFLDMNVITERKATDTERKEKTDRSSLKPRKASLHSPTNKLLLENALDSKPFINKIEGKKSERTVLSNRNDIQSIRPRKDSQKFDKSDFYRPMTAKFQAPSFRKSDLLIQKPEAFLKLNQFDFARITKRAPMCHIPKGIFPKRNILKFRSEGDDTVLRNISKERGQISPNFNLKNFNKKVEKWLFLDEFERWTEYKTLRISEIKAKSSHSFASLSSKPQVSLKNKEKTQTPCQLPYKKEPKLKPFQVNLVQAKPNMPGSPEKEHQLFGKGEQLKPWLNITDSFNDSGPIKN